jgi:hypothetical protein
MSIVTLNNRALRSATAVGTTTALGAMTFIKKLTASSSATLSFVDGSSSVVLDNTYKEYLFTFKDIHPASDTQRFTFQTSTNTGSSYGVTVTSTAFGTYNYENDSDRGLANDSNNDGRNQETTFQPVTNTIGNGNDECGAGFLHLFNPSSTTFVKHWISNACILHNEDLCSTRQNAGYFNTTSAIDAVQFKMASGNIDSGDICLYGIN